MISDWAKKHAAWIEKQNSPRERFTIHRVRVYRNPKRKTKGIPNVYLQRNNMALLGFKLYSEIRSYLAIEPDTPFGVYSVSIRQRSYDLGPYALIFQPMPAGRSNHLFPLALMEEGDNPADSGHIELDETKEILRFPDPILWTYEFARLKQYKQAYFLMPPDRFVRAFDDPSLENYERKLLIRKPLSMAHKIPWQCLYTRSWIIFLKMNIRS